MIQLSSRGRRNAPVKNTRRAMCITIAPRNTSAAQWWVWRTSSPARTPKLNSTTEAYASLITTPCSGA